jgi:hypothetical protein
MEFVDAQVHGIAAIIRRRSLLAEPRRNRSPKSLSIITGSNRRVDLKEVVAVTTIRRSERTGALISPASTTKLPRRLQLPPPVSLCFAVFRPSSLRTALRLASFLFPLRLEERGAPSAVGTPSSPSRPARKSSNIAHSGPSARTPLKQKNPRTTPQLQLQIPLFPHLAAPTWSDARTTARNREDPLCASTTQPPRPRHDEVTRAKPCQTPPKRPIQRAGAKRSQLRPLCLCVSVSHPLQPPIFH